MALLDQWFPRGAKTVFALFLGVAVLTVLFPARFNAQTSAKRRAKTVPTGTHAGVRSSRSKQPTQQRQPEAILNVTAPVTNTTVGANFLIPVTCGNTTGLGVVSFQFDLVFNPSAIVPQMNPISTTGTISDGMLPTYNVIGNTLKVVFFTTTPRTGAGILFYFKFTAVGPIGSSSPLTWMNFMWNEGNPGASTTPGQVNIVGPTAAGAGVNGRVLTAAGQSVGNCLLTLTDTHGHREITRSSPFGYFQFSDLPTGETYVLAATSHSVTFTERVFTLTGDLTAFDLIADP
jgi:hypothetical protein